MFVRRNSYETAMEIEIAPFYSKVNGISSVTNGQCVVINETQNIIFDETDQVKSPDKNSVRNSIVELNETTQDITDSDAAKGRRRSIISLSEVNLKPSRLVIAIGICCVIGFSLPPTILHFVDIDLQLHDNLYTSDNFSVTVNSCNVSTLPDFTLVYTYEALRMASQLTSPFCITKLSETLTQPTTCRQLNNFTYMTDVMCQQVRQNYCTAEWRSLELNSTISEGLIDCDEETASVDCGKQFDLAYNDSICLPLCNRFAQYDETYTAAYFAVAILSHLTNMIGGIIVLVIVFIKRQKMFRFPQVLIVMNVIIMTIIALFLFIPLVTLDSWSPLCPSKYLDLTNSPTAFCQLQGFVWTSGTVMYGFFWVLYVFHLTLRLVYPLKSAKLNNSAYGRKIYALEVFIAVVIGTVPYIVFASTSTYQISRFPPAYCLYNTTYYFYGTYIPTLIIGCVGLILMLFVLYKLHVHQGIFKRRSTGKQIRTCHFTTPEVKVFIGFTYLLIVLIMQWTVATVRHVTLDAFIDHLVKYLRCMSTGINNPICESSRRQLEDYSYPVLSILHIMLVGLLNFSNLPFVVQFRTVKHTVRRATKRLSSKSLNSGTPHT